MNGRIITTFVIALATIVFADAASPQTQSVTDPDAYAVYAAVLPSVWATVSRETLLLQQETEDIAAVRDCLLYVTEHEPDWQAVEQNFEQGNAQVHELERALPIEIPYRLIPRADILADDARLALKYPGLWERRPESLEFAAVSSVGFNATKDKAIVYVRLRSSGIIHILQLRQGKWGVAILSRGCGGWNA